MVAVDRMDVVDAGDTGDICGELFIGMEWSDVGCAVFYLLIWCMM